MFENIYSGKRVLVTGHTGFKGSWLAAWLLQLGAEVAGYSVDVPTQPSHFEVLGLKKRIRDFRGDVRDLKSLTKAVRGFKPDMVFHLAAQPLVRRSYAEPVETFEVNALGTLNMLEALRGAPSIRAAVMVTSDKCYRNVEWDWGYRETDMLGGKDPYSASKGCAELVAYSYIHSFFSDRDSPAVATARAGNVIGGGDWAQDRIVPDCMRAWSKGKPVEVRHPESTRPWQHVLEPLSGYLWLGRTLWRRDSKAAGSAFNFGPDAAADHRVLDVIRNLSASWPKAKWKVLKDKDSRKESKLLKLCCDKAFLELGWKAALNFEETVRMTGLWYERFYGAPKKSPMLDFTLDQIGDYTRLAAERTLPWAA